MSNAVKIVKVTLIFLTITFLFNGCSSSKLSVKNSTSNTTSTSSGEEKIKVNSGLLLGLVKEPNLKNTAKNNTGFENKQVEEYRTLWLYGDGTNINCLEKKDGIITPYGDKFLKLTSNNIVDSDTISSANKNDNFYSKYSTYYNYSVALSQDVNDTKILLNKDSLKNNYISTKEGQMDGAFISRTETILYVGNKYAAIKTSQYNTGGGTYKSGFDDVKMYDINELRKLGNKKGISLKNLLGNDAAANMKNLSTKYNEVSEGGSLVKSKKMIDDNNLILNRREGKWTVQAPLYQIYTHEGNGSNYNNIHQLYGTNIDVPKTLTSYDTLSIDWNTIKSKIPDAKDAVSSPNKDMLVVLTSKDLKVFGNPENGLNKPIKTIPVDSREKIVLNQWANGEFVEKWTKLIK